MTLSNCSFYEDYVLYLWAPSVSRQWDVVQGPKTSHTRQQGRLGPNTAHWKQQPWSQACKWCPEPESRASNAPSREHLAGELASSGVWPGCPLDNHARQLEVVIDLLEGSRKDRRVKGTLLFAYSLFPFLHSLQLHLSDSWHTAQIRVVPHSYHASGRGDAGGTVHIPEQARPSLFQSLRHL